MEKRNIYQRLADAMGKVDYIQKDKKSGMRYSIVSHDAVTAKVRPALLESGIVYFISDLIVDQNGNRTEAQGTITFVNIDAPTEQIRARSFGYGIDDQDKGPGKAMSYMVKYALLKTLGLETGDDPDEDQDVHHRSSVVETLEAAIDLMTEDNVIAVRDQLTQNKQRMSTAEVMSLSQKFKKRLAELKIAD